MKVASLFVALAFTSAEESSFQARMVPLTVIPNSANTFPEPDNRVTTQFVTGIPLQDIQYEDGELRDLYLRRGNTFIYNTGLYPQYYPGYGYIGRYRYNTYPNPYPTPLMYNSRLFNRRLQDEGTAFTSSPDTPVELSPPTESTPLAESDVAIQPVDESLLQAPLPPTIQLQQEPLIPTPTTSPVEAPAIVEEPEAPLLNTEIRDTADNKQNAPLAPSPSTVAATESEKKDLPTTLPVPKPQTPEEKKRKERQVRVEESEDSDTDDTDSDSDGSSEEESTYFDTIFYERLQRLKDEQQKRREKWNARVKKHNERIAELSSRALRVRRPLPPNKREKEEEKKAENKPAEKPKDVEGEKKDNKIIVEMAEAERNLQLHIGTGHGTSVSIGNPLTPILDFVGQYTHPRQYYGSMRGYPGDRHSMRDYRHNRRMQHEPMHYHGGYSRPHHHH